LKIGIIALDSFHDVVPKFHCHEVDADILSILPESSLAQNHSIASFLSKAQGYDLIHSIGSTQPLLFSYFLEVPILTTILEEPTRTEINICTSAPQSCFFVTAKGMREIPGLKTISSIDLSQTDIGRFYSGVYNQIVRACAREENRPWGFYEVLCDAKTDHKVKRITLWPKKRLSLQKHESRSERWIVISGKARVTLNKDEIILRSGQTVEIPRGAVHRVENIGNDPLIFIEVQQGDYFGEDDIIRLEDDYGRI
jgi:mannose-6-phosphate isomerase-like protein (cupin superfamily)